MDYNNIIRTIVSTVSVLFVLVTHEYAHAYVAYLNGDNTAKDEGRLSFNPLRHLDPLGTVSIILFKFGWAKPVPINQLNFRNKRFGLFTVSIAGIAVNILTAIICIFILANFRLHPLLFMLLDYTAFYGIVFAVFNFIPIPPLDGSKILASFLPLKFQYFIYKYEKYFMILLILLFASGLINKFLNPVISFVYKVIISLVTWG